MCFNDLLKSSFASFTKRGITKSRFNAGSCHVKMLGTLMLSRPWSFRIEGRKRARVNPLPAVFFKNLIKFYWQTEKINVYLKEFLLEYIRIYERTPYRSERSHTEEFRMKSCLDFPLWINFILEILSHKDYLDQILIQALRQIIKIGAVTDIACEKQLDNFVGGLVYRWGCSYRSSLCRSSKPANPWFFWTDGRSNLSIPGEKRRYS